MASAVFDFDQQKAYAQSIEVPDVGNFAMRCSNALYDEYYVAVQTIAGKAYILKFGPIQADVGVLLSDFSLVYKKVDYKETVIEREVGVLLNDAKKKITKVEPISVEEALSFLPTAEMFNPGE